MSAATQIRKIVQRGSAGADIPGLAKILAGTKWYRGSILVGHGDRMMVYPTGGFNNADTAAAGGPLQVPGTDANGGLRLIAKSPNVRFRMNVAGAGTAVSVAVIDAGTTEDVVVTANTGVIAVEAQRAIKAHTHASSLVDVAVTGTGLGAVADFATETAVPFVRLLGLANGDVDASADSSDVDVDDPIDYPYTIRRGVLGLMPDAAFSLSGRKYVTDNQTVTENYAALKLPIFCDEVDDGLAFCRFE